MMRNVHGIDGSETKLIASKVRFVYDSLVSGRAFSGLEELLFNMGLPKMFSKTHETYAGFFVRPGRRDVEYS